MKIRKYFIIICSLIISSCSIANGITSKYEDKNIISVDYNNFICDDEKITEYYIEFSNQLPELEEELAKLYSNGNYLITLFSTDNVFGVYPLTADKIEIDDINGDGIKETYFETGYDYNSFHQMFLNVFTEEITNGLYNKYPFFYSLNGELWATPTTLSRDVSVVYKEFEIIEKTSSVFRFRCKKYHITEEMIRDYDPNTLDKYNISYDYYTFSKISSTWKITECPFELW